MLASIFKHLSTSCLELNGKTAWTFSHPKQISTPQTPTKYALLVLLRAEAVTNHVAQVAGTREQKSNRLIPKIYGTARNRM